MSYSRMPTTVEVVRVCFYDVPSALFCRGLSKKKADSNYCGDLNTRHVRISNGCPQSKY